jgi:hypothetical protein
MYNMGYGDFTPEDFIYTDTDSIKIGSEKVFNKWYEDKGKLKMKDIIFPECMGLGLGYDENTEVYFNGDSKKIKCIGQFEDELYGKNHDIGIFTDKKEYMSYNSKNKNESAKILLKGVNKDSSVLYSDLPKTFEFNNKTYYLDTDIITIKQNKKAVEYTINKNIYDDEDLYNGFTEYITKVNKDKTYVVNKCEKLLSDKMKGIKNIVIGTLFKREIIKTGVRVELFTKLI